MTRPKSMIPKRTTARIGSTIANSTTAVPRSSASPDLMWSVRSMRKAQGILEIQLRRPVDPPREAVDRRSGAVTRLRGQLVRNRREGVRDRRADARDEDQGGHRDQREEDAVLHHRLAGLIANAHQASVKLSHRL